MKPPPLLHRVIGGIPFLLLFAIIYLVARCAGWNPN